MRKGEGGLISPDSLGTLFRLTLASGVAAAVEVHPSRGAPLNGRDSQGRTPLMLAAMRGHADVCRVLLRAGANTALRDLNGDDAATLARAKGHKSILLLLSDQLPQAGLDASSLPSALKEGGATATVAVGSPCLGRDTESPEGSSRSVLSQPQELSIGARTTEVDTAVGDARRVEGGAAGLEWSDGEEGGVPDRWKSAPRVVGSPTRVSDAPAWSAPEMPRAEPPHLAFVDEKASQFTVNPCPTLTDQSKTVQPPTAPVEHIMSAVTLGRSSEGHAGAPDATGSPRKADNHINDIVLGLPGEAAWEPETEPDLTHSRAEIAAAAAERENAVSRHAADLPDADWTDTHIELPDTAPDWTAAFKERSDGFRAIARLLSAALREGWVLAEELDELRQSLVDGERGGRLILALEVLLKDLGIVVEDEHAIDWARMGTVESDNFQTSTTAHDDAAAVDRLTEIWGGSPDAERLLLEAASIAPVLSKASEKRLFRELAASLTVLQGSVAKSPVSAPLLENWADQLDARSVVPREISEASWGADDEAPADALEAYQDSHAFLGQTTTLTDLPEVAGSHAADALAAHLRATAKAIRRQRAAAQELLASARLTSRRIIELAEASLCLPGARRSEGLRAKIRCTNGGDHELALLRRPLSGAAQRRDPVGLDEAFQRYISARQTIVEGNLKRVVWLARRYGRGAVPFLDLFQEGQIGLLRAIDRFDPERGARFGTYATWWIRQSITRSVQEQGRTIRVPVHMMERIAKAKRVAAAFRAKNGTKPTLQELADALETEVPAVERTLTADLEGVRLDDAESLLDEEAVVPAPLVVEATPLTALLYHDLRRLLAASLGSLDARQARIIDLRFGLTDGNPLTLEEVGQVYGVTRERIRQIEAKALKRLPRLLPNRQFENLVP